MKPALKVGIYLIIGLLLKSQVAIGAGWDATFPSGFPDPGSYPGPIASSGNKVYVVAINLSQTQGVIYRWDNAANPKWAQVPNSQISMTGGWVNAIAISGSSLYVGGSAISAVGSTGLSVNNVARFNLSNNTWSRLGTALANGVNDHVRAICIGGNGDVYLGGRFSMAGGTPANNVASWNPTTSLWNAMTGGVQFDPTDQIVWVSSIAVSPGVFYNNTYQDYVYVGGHFARQVGQSTTKNIARWSKYDSTWIGLGDLLHAERNSATGCQLVVDNRNAWVDSVVVGNSGNSLFISGSFNSVNGSRDVADPLDPCSGYKNINLAWIPSLSSPSISRWPISPSASGARALSAGILLFASGSDVYLTGAPDHFSNWGLDTHLSKYSSSTWSWSDFTGSTAVAVPSGYGLITKNPIGVFTSGDLQRWILP